jgi:hypothetical protein
MPWSIADTDYDNTHPWRDASGRPLAVPLAVSALRRGHPARASWVVHDELEDGVHLRPDPAFRWDPPSSLGRPPGDVRAQGLVASQLDQLLQ